MSRVFEALTRAGKEKETGAISLGGQWALREKTLTAEGINPDPADDILSVSVALPHPELQPRSWREKLEELIFGWDLRRYKTHPIVALEKESPTAEQYKILREQVKRVRSETGIRCLSVTSPVKRDGKTMVAVNLAAAIALEYEEQVLLIDGDLRSPEIHRYFGIRRSPGLADYLSSDADGDLMNYVQATFLPNLQILPAGRPSALTSELLAKEKMRSLMREIRSRFPNHQVIVDTSPVLSTPDPLVLGNQVDKAIIVIRAGKTPRDYILKAIQAIQAKKVMGIVLNGVEHGMASKYYNYSNGQNE